MKINWEKVKKTSHEILVVLVSITVGILLTISYNKLNQPKPILPNSYSTIYTPKQISVAVNESNDLLIIDKKTGNYIMYSDSVGQNIFKMYVNKIYQEHEKISK